MNRCLIGLVLCLLPVVVVGADPDTPEYEQLPAPQMSGGRPLMEVLRDRKSTREFSTEPVDREQLANLLWAGFGVNRPETGQRTAPCTMNLRSIDMYVATTDSVYRYDAEAHRLVVIGRKDIRTLTGGQDYVKVAPVAIMYVADHAKLEKVTPAERTFYGATDAGLIAQNVYLYCASEGLGCVVHMPGDRAAITQALGLRPEQQIVLAHTVGHAANAPSNSK
ncbi:MAG: nitroreductase family protein [Pirellulaceae bacterium]